MTATEAAAALDARRPDRSLRDRLTTRRSLGRIITLLGALLLIFWTMLPLGWAILASFKTSIDIYGPNIIPSPWDPSGWINSVRWPGFNRFFYNSTFLAVTSTAAAVTISAIGAYGFSRYAFKYRHLLLLMVLLPRLIPRISLIVPLHKMLGAAGITDSVFALVLLYTASAVPLMTWILVGFFAAVPKELEEAAVIDGAGTMQRLRRIVLPLATPGLVTVTVLGFREAWNEFPFVLAFASGPEARTLPYQLFLMQTGVGFQDWSLINAFALITIIPIVLLYLAFEKHVISGLTSGAVK